MDVHTAAGVVSEQLATILTLCPRDHIRAGALNTMRAANMAELVDKVKGSLTGFFRGSSSSQMWETSERGYGSVHTGCTQPPVEYDSNVFFSNMDFSTDDELPCTSNNVVHQMSSQLDFRNSQFIASQQSAGSVPSQCFEASVCSQVMSQRTYDFSQESNVNEVISTSSHSKPTLESNNLLGNQMNSQFDFRDSQLLGSQHSVGSVPSQCFGASFSSQLLSQQTLNFSQESDVRDVDLFSRKRTLDNFIDVPTKKAKYNAGMECISTAKFSDDESDFDTNQLVPCMAEEEEEDEEFRGSDIFINYQVTNYAFEVNTDAFGFSQESGDSEVPEAPKFGINTTLYEFSQESGLNELTEKAEFCGNTEMYAFSEESGEDESSVQAKLCENTGLYEFSEESGEDGIPGETPKFDVNMTLYEFSQESGVNETTKDALKGNTEEYGFSQESGDNEGKFCENTVLYDFSEESGEDEVPDTPKFNENMTLYEFSQESGVNELTENEKFCGNTEMYEFSEESGEDELNDTQPLEEDCSKLPGNQDIKYGFSQSSWDDKMAANDVLYRFSDED